MKDTGLAKPGEKKIDCNRSIVQIKIDCESLQILRFDVLETVLLDPVIKIRLARPIFLCNIDLC